MRARTFSLFGLALMSLGCSGPVSLVSSTKSDGEISDTEVSKVSLVLYGNQFGLVHERRSFELKEGPNELEISGISREFDQNSPSFSFDDPEIQVRQTTFRLGALGTAELAKRFDGKSVEMIWRGQDGKVGQTEKGLLRVLGDGRTSLETEKALLVEPNGTLVLPKGVGSSISPSLNVNLKSKNSGRKEGRFSYLSGGFDWSSNYVATLDRSTKRMSLECWATVENQTGVDFENATVELVSGDIEREQVSYKAKARDFPADQPASISNLPSMSNAAPVAGVLTYRLVNPVNVRTNQSNRLALMSFTDVPYERILSVNADTYSGTSRKTSLPVSYQLKIQNRKDRGLGRSLPAGEYLFYEKGGGDTPVLIGSERQGTLEPGSTTTFNLSGSRDHTATIRTVRVQKINRKQTARTLEAEITSRSDKSSTVTWNLWHGGMNITTSTLAPLNKGVGTSTWQVVVPPKGTVKFQVTVRG
jgi:hypothetical protein